MSIPETTKRTDERTELMKALSADILEKSTQEATKMIQLFDLETLRKKASELNKQDDSVPKDLSYEFLQKEWNENQEKMVNEIALAIAIRNQQQEADRIKCFDLIRNYYKRYQGDKCKKYEMFEHVENEDLTKNVMSDLLSVLDPSVGRVMKINSEKPIKAKPSDIPALCQLSRSHPLRPVSHCDEIPDFIQKIPLDEIRNLTFTDQDKEDTFVGHLVIICQYFKENITDSDHNQWLQRKPAKVAMGIFPIDTTQSEYRGYGHTTAVSPPEDAYKSILYISWLMPTPSTIHNDLPPVDQTTEEKK